MQTRIILNEKEWDGVISKFPEATIYHTSLWKKLLEKHGCKGFLIVAEENDSVRGILPLYLQRNSLGMNYFVSIPFCDQDGLIVENNNNRYIKAIGKSLLELIKEYNTVKTIIQSQSILMEKSVVIPRIRYFFINKRYTEEYIWENLLSRNTRKEISKIARRGVEFFSTKKSSYYKEAFEAYRNVLKKRKILKIQMKKEFFKDVFEILNDNLYVFLTKKDGETLSISSCFIYNNVVYCWSLGSLLKENHNFSHEIHMWETIKFAVNNGCKYVDFSTAPLGDELGIHNFKGRFKTDTLVTFTIKIVNSKIGLVEDFIYSTLLGAKELFFRM